MALFGLLLRTLSFHAFGLDELGSVIHREASEFFAFGAEQRCAGASVAGVTVRIESAHAVLVGAGVLKPVLASQEPQTLVPMTLACCGSLGARSLYSLGDFPYAGIALCPTFCDLCSPFG